VAWKYAVGVPGSGNTYINSPVISTVSGVAQAPAWVVYEMDMTGTLHAVGNAGAVLYKEVLASPARDPQPSTPAVLADGSMFLALGTTGGSPTSLYLLSDSGTITFSEPFGTGGFASCPALAQDGTLFLADAFSGSSACGGFGSLGDPSSALAFSTGTVAVTQAGGLALPLTAQSNRFGVVVAADDTSYWANNGQFFAVSPPASGFALLADWPACGVTLASSTAHPVSDVALDSLTTGYLLAYSAWETSFGSGYGVQGNLAALDPATGATKWTVNLPATNLAPGWTTLQSDVGNAAPAIALDGTVYVGNGDGLRALNGSTGALIWLFSTANVSSSPAIGGDGTVFFGCDDGSFYAVNPNGTLRFKISTGGPISSSPAIAPDGTVVFVSDDGFMYAVQ
jgi:outer membrane protein assembly factor BamB